MVWKIEIDWMDNDLKDVPNAIASKKQELEADKGAYIVNYRKKREETKTIIDECEAIRAGVL